MARVGSLGQAHTPPEGRGGSHHTATPEAGLGTPTPQPARPQSPKSHWEMQVGEVRDGGKETLKGLCLGSSDRGGWRTGERENGRAKAL